MPSSRSSSAIASRFIRGSIKSISGSSNATGAALLRERAGGRPIACAIVLGSGLAGAFRGHPDLTSIAYSQIGGLPEPRAKGHIGEALVGMLGGKRIVAFCGRFHLYEGRTTQEVVSLVELGIAAGAKTLIVTNAAGGLQRTFTPGDVMIIRDQLNLTGTNPLAVPQLPDGITERFVNMSDAYSRNLADVALIAGKKHGLRVQQGTYAGLLGPSFETPAEVTMLRTLGADAVGMSTVLETIMARARGVTVFGASLITNVHDGQPTNSDEVNEEGDRAAPAFAGMLTDIVAELPA
jgi:purine-nucleoside phosphorylase